MRRRRVACAAASNVGTGFTFALALVLLAVVASCTKPAPPSRPPTSKPAPKIRRFDEKPPDDSADRVSLLTLPRGATVVSRSGEAFLEASALRAIDSDPMSFWMGPPHDLPQSMVVALPARSRIDRVGIRTDDVLPTNHVQVDRSMDGHSFVPLLTINSREILEPQWFEVPAVEATHIRVTLVDRVKDDREPRLRSILVRGTELEAPHPGDLSGCWSLNDTEARFERRDSTVTGTVDMRNVPLQLDGGFDGRSYRFNWVRGNDYGYAMFSVSPDGKNLNAIEWHEEAIPLFYGDSWFGEHKPCSGRIAIDPDTRERYLHRAGRFSLFGIRFRTDGSIDRVASADALAWLAKFASANPVQLVAYEYRQPNANANRQFAQRELDAIRDELQRAGIASVTFVAKGSDAPRQQPLNEAMRAIYSTVDVEIRR